MNGTTKIAIIGGVLLLLACGGRPPPPEPVFVAVPPQAPCAEQWVHMPIQLQFATGGAQLDEQSRQILNELVISARGRTDIRRVRVEGHTDTCGNELNNLQLSQERATSVANELVSMAVPQDALETIGYGSTQPIANEDCEGNTDLSQQANRRVEFTFLVCH